MLVSAGASVDRRRKISYTDRRFNRESYFSLGQLVARDGSDKVANTCFDLKLQGSSHNVILTAAYNIAAISRKSNKLNYFIDSRAYIARQGEKTWDKLKVFKKMYVHPNWDGGNDSGFEIGLVTKWEDIGGSNNEQFSQLKFREKDITISFARPKDIYKGMKLEIAGYPGVKKGHPYTGRGTIVEVVQTKKGGWKIYHDIDTIRGYGGSPLMITDERFTWDKGVKKVVIGIHTGDDVTRNLKGGILITPSIFKWIIHNLEKEGPKLKNKFELELPCNDPDLSLQPGTQKPRKPKQNWKLMQHSFGRGVENFEDEKKCSSYALIVSNEQGRFELDAIKLKTVLQDCHYEVTMLLKKTPEEILTGVENFAKKKFDEYDVVIFYVTTHGVNPKLNNGQLKWVFKDQLLDAKQLTDILAKIKVKKMLTLIHSCYAGSAINPRLPKNDKPNHFGENMEKLCLVLRTGKATLCAGPPDDVTFGQIFPTAVFNEFKKALKGKKPLMAMRLFSNVSEEVQKKMNCEQLIWADWHGNDFYVYHP